MRMVRLIAFVTLVAGCQQSPEQKQAQALRDQAKAQAAALAKTADTQAGGLEQHAKALRDQAKQAGGFSGQRLEVQADALSKEAKLIRKQADVRGDAIKESVDARIKTTESR